MLNEFIEVMCWLIIATGISTALAWCWTYLGVFVYVRVKKWFKRYKKEPEEYDLFCIGKHFYFKPTKFSKQELIVLLSGLKYGLKNNIFGEDTGVAYQFKMLFECVLSAIVQQENIREEG